MSGDLGGWGRRIMNLRSVWTIILRYCFRKPKPHTNHMDKESELQPFEPPLPEAVSGDVQPPVSLETWWWEPLWTPSYKANGFVATEIRVWAYCSKNFVTCSNLNSTCIALVFAQNKRVWKRKMRPLWILSLFIDFLRGCCTKSLIHEDLGGQRYNFICQTRLQFCFRQQSLYFKGFQKRSICKV